MNLSIVLPAYMESENLKVLIPRIISSVDKIGVLYEILVIDSMQGDDQTLKVCRQYPEHIKYNKRTGGNNYGDAIRTGISLARYDLIVMMDCDGSHDPEEIISFYEHAKEGADLVIGSRYVKGGNTDNIFILRAMSRILNIFYRRIFKLNVRDVSNSFRLYNAEKLKSLVLVCDNFDIVEEILILLNLIYSDLKIIEHPISFNKRMYGESKRNLVIFIFSYLKTIKRLKEIKKGYLLEKQESLKNAKIPEN